MSSNEELALIWGGALIIGVVAYVIARKIDADRLFGSKTRLMSRVIDVTFHTLLICFLVVYSILDVGKYEAFNLYGLDFSLFDQIVWNSSRGRLFENTLLMDAPLILGQHFSILLLALVPLYSLSPDPRILVILPVACVGLTALLLYWFARHELGRVNAMSVSAAFLLMPGVQYIALGQFYEIMLAMPLLLLATIFLLRRRYSAFFVTLGVLLLCKEDIPLIAAGFGLFLMLVHRKYVLGAALTLASLGWFILLIQKIMPFFQGTSSYYYFGSGGYGTGQYAYLGGNLAEIGGTLLTRPDIIWQHLMVTPKIDTIQKTLIPLGLIPFVGAEVAALVLPTLGYTLLSDRESQFILGSHHYAAVFPFLLLAVVIGIQRILQWFDRRRLSPHAKFAFATAVATFLLTTSLSSYYLYSPGPLSRNFSAARYTPTERDIIGSKLASVIPDDAAVLAQMELLPHISRRSNIYVMPGIPCLTTAQYLFADRRRPWYGYVQEAWDYALRAPFFGTVAERDGYVLKRLTPIAELGNPLALQYEGKLKLLSYALPVTQTVAGGQVLHVLLAWEKNHNPERGIEVQIQLVDNQSHVWADMAHDSCQPISRPHGTTMIVNEDWVLNIPPTIPSGIYRINLALYDKQQARYLVASAPSGSGASSERTITSLRIEKNKGSFMASQLRIEQPLFVDMEEMRFLGYISNRKSFNPGELVQIGLYWRARAQPRGDYSVAVQIRDISNRPVFEQESRPAKDSYPTPQWQAGEVLLDWHDFDLPNDMPAGEYQLFVVLRNNVTGHVLGETLVSKILVAP